MSKELKILLVDDDKIMLFLHEVFLKKSGILCETVLCYNGQEALDFLDNCKSADTTFLVLLDINMPIMNGWEFLSTIRDRTNLPPVYIVMVSSATEESERERAVAFTHVIDYLAKPLTIESCKKIVRAEQIRGFFDDPALS